MFATAFNYFPSLCKCAKSHEVQRVDTRDYCYDIFHLSYFLLYLDDAQQQLLRMKVRGLAGRQKQKFFSIEEDEKIVKALQEALGSPGKLN